MQIKSIFGYLPIFLNKKILRNLKLSILVAIVATLQISAIGYSQNALVSVHLKNAVIVDVFNEIERQTEFKVFYKTANIDRRQTVTIDKDNVTVDALLNAVLDKKHLSFEVIDKVIVITPVVTVAQQGIAITGTVTDESGTLPGVNVTVKGATIGVITDTNGRYSINVPNENAVLVFSFVGYASQEIMVGEQRAIDVTLGEVTRELEEVVIVGFGVQKKVNLTGAVGTVSAADLQNRPVQNVQQALQGLVPGLNIGQSSGFLDATPSVDIRGVGNLNTGSSAGPLVLIDGVESNMSLLNPQDVATISVLKDAAASSIYGSRAPFGVILITTKKGEAGNFRVNYNNNFRWGTPVKVPRMMDSWEHLTYINDQAINDNITPFYDPVYLQRVRDYYDGIITTVEIPNPSNPTRWSGYPNANENWYKHFFKDRMYSNEHNINASGGNDRFNFYMGFRYLDQSGLLKPAEEKFNLYMPTGTIEAQMTDWMKLRYTIRFVRRDYSKPTYFDYFFFETLVTASWPTWPVYDDNGFFTDYNSGMSEGVTKGGRTNVQTDEVSNHASLILEPVKNWVTTVEMNYNIHSSSTHAVTVPTYNHDVYGNPYMRFQDSYVQNSFYKNNFMTMNVYSSYRFDLNDRHHFQVMAGMQTEDLKNTEASLRRVGIIVPDLPVVSLTTGLNPNGTAATPVVSGSMSEWNTTGFFGRFNYDYQGRYLLEANLRYDGTSRFRADKRWTWLPSFSAGWNIARESFWEGLAGTVNLLKLRGSYGKLGNQNTNNLYPTYEAMIVNISSGSWLQGGVKPNAASSPELITAYLTWEKINTVNVGLDAGAFNNRLNASFDYYVRKTLDMMGPATELPVILGKAVPRTNNTDLKTQGFELVLAWQDRLKNGFTYSTRFLLSDSRTTITRYPNFTKSLDTYYEGQQYGEIWGYETVGLAKTNEEMQAHLATMPNGAQNAIGSNWAAGDIMYRDLNGDGRINSGSSTLDDPGDRKVIGNSRPRYAFGLDVNAAWKGFDLRIFLQGIGKRDAWEYNSMFFGIWGGDMWRQINLKDHLDYFRAEPSNDLPANPNAYYARPLQRTGPKNQQCQTRWLQNAAYMRLKNLSLGYTIPSNVTQKFFVDNLRVFFTAENILTFTKMAPMFDPEADNSSSWLGAGYPLQKTISFGVNVTF